MDRAFSHGQHVVITASWHPWRGHSGTLIEAPKDAPFPWVVALDDGYALRAAVKDDEIQSAENDLLVDPASSEQ